MADAFPKHLNYLRDNRPELAAMMLKHADSPAFVQQLSDRLIETRTALKTVTDGAPQSADATPGKVVEKNTSAILTPGNSIQTIHKSVDGNGTFISFTAEWITQQDDGQVSIFAQSFDDTTSTGTYSVLLTKGQSKKVKNGLWNIAYDGQAVKIS